MKLFRANNRHPKDERVLLIDNIDDFALWRKRKELVISGIFYKHAVADKVIDSAKKLRCQDFALPHIYDLESSIIFHTDDNETSFEEQLKNGNISSELYGLPRTLKDIWVNVASNNRSHKLIFRLNSIYPQERHEHRTALTMSIFGGGTIFYNERGYDYQAEDNQICLFERIEHRAPHCLGNSITPSGPRRVNFVIG